MIELPADAPMAEYQRYIHALEDLHGWLDADLARNCFLMGEEVGELFRAVRRIEGVLDSTGSVREERVANVSEEIVDVLNYLLAIANRLDIDVEQAFREKNAHNQTRVWK